MTTTNNTPAATAQTTIFVNLFAAIKAEKEQHLQEFTASLMPLTDAFDILSMWQYKDLLTPAKKRIIWDLSELKAYLIDRKKKVQAKQLDKELQRLITIEKAEDLKGDIKITMEWKNNRTWGSNPTAEAWVNNEYFNSGSISGCGYDKGSTAVAAALNQSNSFLKALYLLKEQNPTMKNQELFGYGSGYGILPRLEGGVGVSCYPTIFAKIGLNFQTVASGKTYDVYAVTKA